MYCGTSISPFCSRVLLMQLKATAFWSSGLTIELLSETEGDNVNSPSFWKDPENCWSSTNWLFTHHKIGGGKSFDIKKL